MSVVDRAVVLRGRIQIMLMLRDDATCFDVDVAVVADMLW